MDKGSSTRDVQRTTIESFFRSIGDLRQTDLRQPLTTLKIPTLGIYGKKDNIVSPKNARLLREHVEVNQVTMMHNSRHFPMIDEPAIFMQTLDTFLQNSREGIVNDIGE